MRRFLFLRLGEIYYVIDRRSKGVLATIRGNQIEAHRDIVGAIASLKEDDETVVEFIKRASEG